jgi:hypothetical protein
LYGVADANDPEHQGLVSVIEQWPGELVVSAFTAAEADHLILGRLGIGAELALLEDLAINYSVQTLDAAGLRLARDLCAQYRDLELGLADASTVVLAGQWATRTIVTFDHRHFRVVTPLQGGAFELLPADL